MGQRRLFYYGPLIKESGGKELYAFLFNDCMLIVEGTESLHSEVFKATAKGSSAANKLLLYKQPILLDSISIVQSKQQQSDCTFQIVCDEKEYSFKTTNPTLK